MPTQAIIDLGSNTIRLCVYKIYDFQQVKLSLDSVTSDNSENKSLSIKTEELFTEIFNSKTMAGLASYVQNGVMSPAGIKKAIKTIKGHLKMVGLLRCDDIHVFATAVLRNCSNSKTAVREIEEALGVPVTVLSNEEEAHLGYIGMKLTQEVGEGTLIDIGGGSTEFTEIKNGHDESVLSLPQGSLSSFAQFSSAILPSISEMKHIFDAFSCHLNSLYRGHYVGKPLFGIGGTVRSAAKIYGDLFREGQRCPFIKKEHLEEILSYYVFNPNEFAHRALRTIPDRIHTFIPGCILLKAIFDFCEAEKLSICKYGLREGYLVERVLCHR